MTLRTKGNLIFVVLMLMELVFVGAHGFLLYQDEQESLKQEAAKEIINRANNVLELMYVAGDAVTKYGLSKEKSMSDRYETAAQKVADEMNWLEKACAREPEQARLLASIRNSVRDVLEKMDQLKLVVEKEEQLVAMRYGLKQQAKVQTLLESLVRDLLKFLSVEREIEERSPAAIQKQRDTTKIVLLTGLAANILAALFLVRFFIGNVTSKVAREVENVDRLRRHQSLLAPLIEGDELSQFDASLHEMSSALLGEEYLIKAADEEMRTVLEQLPLGFFVLLHGEGQKDYVIEYANPTMERIFKAPSRSLNGQRLSQFVQSVPFVKEDVDKVLLLARTVSGEEMNVELSMVTIALGNRLRKLATVVDVTARVELEKMKQAFVAMVSHDLRTPLTSVGGFLQLMPAGVYGSMPPEAIQEGEVAQRHTDHLISLINDLLDLEKLKAGQLEMSRVDTAIEDVIDGAMDNLSELSETRGVNLIFTGADDHVFADCDRLVQAVTKMLTVLIELADKGKDIKIEAHRGPIADGGQNGLGLTCSLVGNDLPAENLDQFFLPFQSIDAKGRVAPGLGLSLADAILRAHGGKGKAAFHQGRLQLICYIA